MIGFRPFAAFNVIQFETTSQVLLIFQSSFRNHVVTPMIETPRLFLRLAAADDVPAIIAYYRENDPYLQPFEPLRSANFYTADFWQATVQRSADDFAGGRSVRMFLFPKEKPAHIIGSLSFSNIVQGIFQACHVGYTLAENAQGLGYMTEALQVGCRYMFDQQGLHRVMANYMPRNERSAKLLRRLGFRVEGYAYDYLQINGRWEDHILTSLTNVTSQ